MKVFYKVYRKSVHTFILVKNNFEDHANEGLEKVHGNIDAKKTMHGFIKNFLIKNILLISFSMNFSKYLCSPPKNSTPLPNCVVAQQINCHLQCRHPV